MFGEYYFSVDVESVGLHGNPFAIAYVIFKEGGSIVDKCLEYCPLDLTDSLKTDFEWIKENVLPHFKDINYTCDNTKSLYENFWSSWISSKKKYTNIMMIGDLSSWNKFHFTMHKIRFEK